MPRSAVDRALSDGRSESPGAATPGSRSCTGRMSALDPASVKPSGVGRKPLRVRRRTGCTTTSARCAAARVSGCFTCAGRTTGGRSTAVSCVGARRGGRSSVPRGGRTGVPRRAARITETTCARGGLGAAWWIRVPDGLLGRRGCAPTRVRCRRSAPPAREDTMLMRQEPGRSAAPYAAGPGDSFELRFWRGTDVPAIARGSRRAPRDAGGRR
jgi:hypothetical protein